MDPHPPRGLQLTLLCAKYAQCLLKERTGASPPVPTEFLIPFHMRIELEKMVDCVHMAYQRQVRLDYALEDLSEAIQKGGSGTRAELLRRKFKGPFPPKDDGTNTAQLIDKSMVFVDQQSKVIAWYLPDIFTSQRRASVNAAVKTLSDHPKSALTLSRGSESWRDGFESFSVTPNSELRPGNVVLSIAWYNQGHTSLTRNPGPSAALQQGTKNGTAAFLEASTEMNALFGALLSLVHPRLYDMQRQCPREPQRCDARAF
ncbi:hypothetical protein D9611_012901 [Ephemerocybe angulata]|uniref:Uncharacterized protein n=1 Tax=Ephemerocybe angulata TaxID=980116 RepID=A0A8H5C4V4_9AGAR|nr:hypothetical protein D9611_012901 [Tulosesus angulatus]